MRRRLGRQRQFDHVADAVELIVNQCPFAEADEGRAIALHIIAANSRRSSSRLVATAASTAFGMPITYPDGNRTEIMEMAKDGVRHRALRAMKSGAPAQSLLRAV